jgi:hypothetical protein
VRDFSNAVHDPDGIFGIAQWFLASNQVPQLGPSERDFLDACETPGGESPDYPAVQAAAAVSLAAHCARLTGETGRAHLWRAATALETSTLYGVFKIDQATGAQVSHQTVLTRWVDRELTAYQPSVGRAHS